MKKVLFLTTALVASASMAAADVRLSGYGRFGLDTNDANAGTATGKTTLTSRLRIQFDMSTETDGGVTFGGRMRMQANSANGTAGTGAFNGARFFVSSGGLTVGVGNIIGAFENAYTLYQVANSPTAGIGVDGGNYGYLAANMAGNDFNWTAYSSGGAGANGVEAIYNGANFQLHVSYAETAAGAASAAVSGYYSFGDWTVAVAHNDNRPAAGGDGEDVTLVGVTGNLGVATVSANYAKGENYGGAGVDSSKITLSAGFDIGAATNMIIYISDEDSPFDLDYDGSGYGFTITHDLGGGVSLVAGLEETSGTVGNTTVQAGAYFRF